MKTYRNTTSRRKSLASAVPAGVPFMDTYLGKVLCNLTIFFFLSKILIALPIAQGGSDTYHFKYENTDVSGFQAKIDARMIDLVNDNLVKHF